MQATLLRIGFVMLARLAVPAVVEACSCMPEKPPCEQAWASPVVFAGTVTEMLPADAKAWTPRSVRFSISEAFRGVDTVEVVLQMEGTTCDLEFEVGLEYIVYAHHRRSGPGWTTGRCTRTRPLRDGQEDLDYLRRPNAQKGPTRITGQVVHGWTDLSDPNYRRLEREMAGVPVSVTDGETTIETSTDSRGQYSIVVSPRRSYDVTFGPVDGFAIDSHPSAVWISDSRACAGVDAWARYDGRVSGTLIDEAGRPVPHFPVSLLSSPRIPLGPGFDDVVLTDADGHFEFRGIQPARYTIVEGSRFWPRSESRARLITGTISVAPSGRADAGTLRLRTPIMRLVGTVVDADGTPVPAARIRVSRSGEPYLTGEDLLTDAKGRFSVSLVAGSPYEIEGSIVVHDADGAFNRTATASVDATPGTQSIRLELSRSR